MRLTRQTGQGMFAAIMIDRSVSAQSSLMARETRLVDGLVPRSLTDSPLPEQTWQMREDRFLLRGEGEHYFYYRKGEGVAIHRGAGADPSEESLWLNGSLYSAIASINGLLPVHASAVACGGEVYAFTGPPGAGKSTLVAALGRFSLPMFCDDTLVLDLSDPDRISCLPGHKRLKLTEEALALTGAAREEKVSPTVDKFYARPAAGDVGQVLPLAALVFLEEGPDTAITPIRGGEALARLQDDHYTATLFAAAQQFDRAARFAHLARLARQIALASFIRPRDPVQFGAGVAFAAEYVTSRHGAAGRESNTRVPPP